MILSIVQKFWQFTYQWLQASLVMNLSSSVEYFTKENSQFRVGSRSIKEKNVVAYYVSIKAGRLGWGRYSLLVLKKKKLEIMNVMKCLKLGTH